jgi:L-alanine-DL-glutamate epimerase-like enolase superfamily enzyme
MKIVAMETFPAVIPYRHTEVSAIISRSGVSDVVVKLVTDDGLVGWGEACMNCDTATTLAALQAMRPFVLGRSPWQTEAIARDVFVHGGWQWEAMTGSFAFAGIDMALWDLCGKAAGQPLSHLFGGPVREAVDYFYYLAWGDPDSLRAQCAEGLARGHSVFYFKAGADFAAELAMLEVVRDALGPAPLLRVDPNQAWPFADALRNMARMHAAVGLDFVEAPVKGGRHGNLRELTRATGVPVCANEFLWTEADAARVITERAVDHMGFSPYFVGSLRRWHTLCHMAAHADILVHKHTHGEFGIAAAACHHVLLTLPNLARGNQQTHQLIAHDILTEPLPIVGSASWGIIDRPGIGVEVDEAALRDASDRWRRDGDFRPFGDRFARA